MTTYCRDCDNVHPETRGGEPWKWRCIKVPVMAGFKFVDPDFAPNPPYAKCEHVNTDGECQHYTPIPEQHPDFQPPRWKTGR